MKFFTLLLLFFVRKLSGCHKEFEFFQLHIHVALRCRDNSTISTIQNFNLEENHIDSLIIEDTNISTLPPSTFSKFVNLTELHLSNLHIKSIEAGAFDNLVELKELYLDRNELKEVKNNVFNFLHNLLVLNLRNNQIKFIEKSSFLGVKKLQALFLGNNKISAIEKETFQTQKELIQLELTGNPIGSFSRTDLLGVKSLSLSECNLTYFDVNLSNQTKNLLNLSSNQLSEFDFSKFCNTKLLDLSKNRLVTIHKRPCFIEELYLAHNQIRNLEAPFFQDSREIEVIDLGHNQISILDRTFSFLTHLKRLILCENNVTKIYPNLFQDLTNLNHLNLSRNKIEQILYGTFDSLHQLEILDLSYNNLKSLHDHVFHSMRILKSLNFDKNQISSFHVRDYLRHLKMLRNISINHNLWSCKDLVTICRILQIENVRLVDADSYDEENVSGVRCSSYKKGNQGLSVKNSKINSFFNEDFKNSRFVQFFEKDYKRSGFFATLIQQNHAKPRAEQIVFAKNVPNDNLQNILVFSAVTQAIMTVLILFSLLNRCRVRKSS